MIFKIKINLSTPIPWPKKKTPPRPFPKDKTTNITCAYCCELLEILHYVVPVITR